MPSVSEFSEDFNDSRAFICTITGKDFHMANPTFEIEAIAHSLGMICRWAGHCRKFYSVAEHSVLVSKLVPPEYALIGLMHDATEAYLSDIPAPWKPMITGYKEIESYLWGKICEKWGFSFYMPEEIKKADWRALFLEAEELIPGGGKGLLDPMNQFGPKKLHEPWVLGLPPEQATRRFLARYNDLCGESRLPCED